jgi:hypothetical protein
MTFDIGHKETICCEVAVLVLVDACLMFLEVTARKIIG